MGEIPNIVRLVHTFDPRLLQDDVPRILASVASEPAGGGAVEHRDWSSIALYPTRSQVVHSRRRLIESELLQIAPAIHAALATLRCSIQRVRLQSLGPGGVIAEHSDSLLGFSAGLIRIHIPVVTNPAVYFYIDGERCLWQPGELWYGNFSRPHRGENRGDEIRRHLVVDVYVDDLTAALFPMELRARIRELLQAEMREAQSAGEQQYAFQFLLPAGMELPGIALSRAVLGQVSRIGKQFMLLLDHEPQLLLQPLTAASLSIIGLGTPAVIRVAHEAGKICAASLTFPSLQREVALELVHASTVRTCAQTSSTVTAARQTG